MARFVSTLNLVALFSARRGFSSAAAAATRASMGAAEASIMMMKGNEESGANVGTVWTSSWVPDPVTGYYKPANRVGEMDPAVLRQILLSRKST
nr:precursor late embryogenesis abundant proteins containing PF03242 domain [Agave tequilana]